MRSTKFDLFLKELPLYKDRIESLVRLFGVAMSVVIGIGVTVSLSSNSETICSACAIYSISFLIDYFFVVQKKQTTLGRIVRFLYPFIGGTVCILSFFSILTHYKARWIPRVAFWGVICIAVLQLIGVIVQWVVLPDEMPENEKIDDKVYQDRFLRNAKVGNLGNVEEQK